MFELNARRLPHSGGRYKVNLLGNIYNSTDELIDPVLINGEYYVELEWLFGKRSYPVGLLVLLSFDKIKLPEHLLWFVKILYKDGDASNLNLSNLIYCFNCGPLPTEMYPGYYHIPFFNDYAINEYGDIINVYTGKKKIWSVTKPDEERNSTGGYLFNRVVNDEGFSRVLFQHRAMCLVFKEYGGDVLSQVVNHRDGNPSNNNLDNLEWATYKRNNQHAYDNGLRPNASNAILVWDLKTSKITAFPSLSAAARHLGNMRCDFIRWRLRNAPSRIYEDMVLFKYDDETPWPKIDLDNINISRLGNGVTIVTKNVFTGERRSFKGCREASEFTKVLPATIQQHIKNNFDIPVNGYNFRYKECSNVWPNHTERHLAIYKKYPLKAPDGAIVTNIITGEETFYTSVREASEALGLNNRVLSNYIGSNLLIKKLYKARYFKLKKTLGPPIQECVE